jgi:hypothetical protein
MSSAGKGDDYRKVDRKKYDTNFQAIFGKTEPEDDKVSRACGGPNACENRTFDADMKDCIECARNAEYY